MPLNALNYFPAEKEDALRTLSTPSSCALLICCRSRFCSLLRAIISSRMSFLERGPYCRGHFNLKLNSRTSNEPNHKNKTKNSNELKLGEQGTEHEQTRTNKKTTSSSNQQENNQEQVR